MWIIPVYNYSIGELCFGDPDGDEAKELIYGTLGDYLDTDMLYVNDPVTQKNKWKSTDVVAPYYVTAFDLDGDGQKEIIEAGDKGSQSFQSVLQVFDSVKDTLKCRNTSQLRIRSIAAGRLSKSSEAVIVAGTGYGFAVFDAKSLMQTFILGVSSNGTSDFIKIFDVDNDGKMELVTAGDKGYLRIYDGVTYNLKWESPFMSGAIKDLFLTNIDDDIDQEAVILTSNGLIQVFDMKTHEQKWSFESLNDITSIAFSIIRGQSYIIAGRNNGMVSLINCTTKQADRELKAGNDAVTKVIATNIDEKHESELITLSSNIKIFDSAGLNLLWESDPENDRSYSPDGMTVCDADNDGHCELLVTSRYGLYQYQISSPYIEFIPPVVTGFSPAQDTKSYGINNRINIYFSKVMDPSTINSETILLRTGNGSQINTSVSYNESKRTATIEGIPLLPESSLITVIVSGIIKDREGNGLDGNINHFSEGGPVDDFIWSFSTGSGIDTVGPKIFDITLSSDSIWKRIPVTAEMIISDSSSVATTRVLAGEFFIDVPKTNGSGYSISAKDGLFDTACETAVCTISTDSLSMGNHILYFHAKDTLNNWGPFAVYPLYIIVESLKNWPMMGHNPQHTGFNPNDTTRTPLKLRWSKQICSPIDGYNDHYAYPVIYNDLVYLSIGGQYTETVRIPEEVVALRTDDGSEEWSYSFGNIFSVDNPAVAYGIVYVQTCNNTPGSFVNAFDALTGKLLWKEPFNAQWQETYGPIVDGGKVFIDGGYYGGIYAYDAFTGKNLWFNSLPQEFNWSPTYFDKHLYVSYTDGPSFYKISADSGKVVYTYGSPWTMAKTPVISNGKILTINPVTAIDLKTYKTLWSKSGEYLPGAANNKIFIANSTLRVYDENTGKQLWEFEGDKKIKCNVVITSNYVFVCSENNIYAINLMTQKCDWSYPAGGHISAADGKIFVFSKNGKLYCFSDLVTSVQTDKKDLPQSYSLEQNFPNPFNPETTISYTLPKSNYVQLKVYDILGTEVASLVDEPQEAGQYQIHFNAGGLSSGIYFYSLKAGNFSRVLKMILLK